MALTTRRDFVQQAAFAAGTALCGRPTSVFADAQNTLNTPDQNAAPLDAAAIRKLASRINGQVITADKPGYESARLIFNRAFDRRPALIIHCADASDVARTLEFTQSHNLPLAVRGGGHSRAGFGVCDAGVVIDLSGMNHVAVDAGGRMARAGAGALVVHLDAAAQRFGLATTSGGCPTVGIAGLTLGGGEGLLMSKYGAACDNLLMAQLVTVDGRLVEASQSTNADLFWAIRGGGGNFGVVTALTYRLHPLTQVLAGTLAYPAEQISEMLQTFANFVAAAPDEMSVVGQVLPSEGGPLFKMLVCHCGDSRSGNDLLRPWRSLHPEQNTVRVMSYLEANATINPAGPASHFQTNLFLPDLSAAAIETITSAVSGAPLGTRVFIVPFYGAITRVRLSDAAFPLRSFGYELDIMGRWGDPTDRPRAVHWVKALRDALLPFSKGAYVNQLGETSEELVRFAYGAQYARLAAIKAKYDPLNVLRLNQNIKPG